MPTPLYDSVVTDLGWSPDELRPTYDLAGALVAAGELAREQLAADALDQVEEAANA